MTMICNIIQPNPATNICTFKATDDVTGAQRTIEIPFSPQTFNALFEITAALAITPEPTDQNPTQLLWAAAIAIEEWPDAVIENVNGDIFVRVDNNTVSKINIATGQLEPIY